MSRYPAWTARRAARFGYLAGRGLSVDAIGSDETVGAASRRSVLAVATRWGIPLGAAGNGSVMLPEDISRGLAAAAMARRLSVEALSLRILRRIASDKLVTAVLDDGK
jgi:hypothetical protein